MRIRQGWMAMTLAVAMLPPAARPTPAAEWEAAAPVTLPGVTQRLVRPAGGGEPFLIYLALPDRPAPADGYPVLYVLDANAVIGTLVEALRLQSRRTDVTRVEPMAIVGIGYPDAAPHDIERRWFDYTPPTESPPVPPRPDGPAPRTGGADAFLDFIDGELKPAIEAEVPIDRRRQTLAGHSLGGLFALYALLHRPAAFQRYAAISPSLWWNDRDLLARMADARAVAGERVLIAIGAREAQSDPPRQMIENAREMAARLAGLGAIVELVELADEDHASVLMPALGRALRLASAPAP